MSDESAPGPDLRDRIARALRAAAVNLNYAPEGLADAVMVAVVQPELDRRDTEIRRHREALDVVADADLKHQFQRDQLKATVDRVKALAEDMRTWCSPHGIAVTYAQRIDEAIDPPEQDPDALLIGSDTEAEFAAKLGAIMRKHRAEVHPEHQEDCGNCAVIKGAPEVLAACICHLVKKPTYGCRVHGWAATRDHDGDLAAVRAFAAKHDPREEPPCPTT